MGLIFKQPDLFLALTAMERMEAMRRLTANVFTQRIIIYISVMAIIVLTLALVYISQHNKKEEDELSDEMFNNYADKRGLSKRERQILRYMASRAGMQKLETIFTLESAFDTGSARLLEEVSEKDHNLQVASEIAFLREKLGFRKRSSLTVADMLRKNKLSTRQLPVDKKIQLTRRKGSETEDIEATVTKNSEFELLLKLSKPVEDPQNTILRGRYYFGASVWEFDIFVTNCIEDILVLRHCDEVRHINRRRFLRVPVDRPGFIAAFDFSKDMQLQMEKTKADDSFRNIGHDDIIHPEFHPASVKEIAGPGFLVESDLKVQVGQRVVLIFAWENSPEPIKDTSSTIVKYSVVEDIAEVKRFEEQEDKNIIAIEMYGVGDAEIDKLIKITNEASRRNSNQNKNPNKNVQSVMV